MPDESNHEPLKQGDLVECIRGGFAPSHALTSGRIYRVTDTSGTAVSRFVVLQNLDGTYVDGEWMASRFVKLERNPTDLQDGDAVLVTAARNLHEILPSLGYAFPTMPHGAGDMRVELANATRAALGRTPGLSGFRTDHKFYVSEWYRVNRPTAQVLRWLDDDPVVGSAPAAGENPELEAFKAKVREAVIREAERRDWCDEADAWLEELGLESRRSALPRGLYAMVELRVPTGFPQGLTPVAARGVPRVAVRREDGWIELRANGTNPLTEHAVHALAARDDDGKIKVLFEGL